MTRLLTQQELENFPSLDWSDIAPRVNPPVALRSRASNGNAGRTSSHARTVLAPSQR